MDKWNGNRGEQTEQQAEPATISGPKPGNFPLGSLESRAAARENFSTENWKGYSVDDINSKAAMGIASRRNGA